MKLHLSFTIFSLFYTIFILTIYLTSGEKVEGSYGTVIKQIYKKSGANEVIIIQTAPQNSFETFTILRDIHMTMLPNLNSITMIKLELFSQRPIYHVERAKRPLVIITISDMPGVEAIGRLLPMMNMYDPVWLVVFVEEPDLVVCRYCRDPHENLLYLDEFSKVLIWCCKASVIESWVSEDGQSTRRGQVARWIGREREMEWFEDVSDDGAPYSLYGRGLRIVVVTRSNYVKLVNGELAGYLGDVISELAYMLNFTIATITEAQSLGRSTDNASVNSVVARFNQGAADLAFGPFLMTNARRDIVDFTGQILTGKTYLYFKMTEGFYVHWDTHFKVFDPYVWNSILAMILLLPIFLTLIRYHPKLHHFLPLVFEHYFNVWGIYCQQGLDVFPWATSLRILYTSVFLSTLVISAAYSGCLISHLALPRTALPFNTLEEFIEDGTYKLIVLRNSADSDLLRTASDLVFRRMAELQEPDELLPVNASQAFEQVCTEKVAFYASELLRLPLQNEISCELSSIDGQRRDTFALVLPKHSLYTEYFDFYIGKLRDNRLLLSLLRRHFPVEEDFDVNHPEANIVEVLTLFLILIGGMGIAVVICVIEKIIFFWNRKSMEKQRRVYLKEKMRKSWLSRGPAILRTALILRRQMSETINIYESH